MIVNNTNYSSEIEEMIIANLDGWTVEQPTTTQTQTQTTTTSSTSEVEPFMSTEELNNKSNKTITQNECRLFYEETLDLALLHTNRFNIDDLSVLEAKAFLRAVCKWTASNLWNKYNIRVNNEDMEDTYLQSYGGLLYNSAMKALKPFINQRITGVETIRTAKDKSDDDIWIV